MKRSEYSEHIRKVLEKARGERKMPGEVISEILRDAATGLGLATKDDFDQILSELETLRNQIKQAGR